MADRQPVVTAEHLSKWYGQVSGLNDVTQDFRLYH